MARLIEAYRRYRPRVQTGTPVDPGQLADYIAQHTGVDRHEVGMVLGEMQDAVLHFITQGRGVKLPGLVSLWPEISSRGELRISRRFDSGFTTALRDPARFGGRIRNYERRTWEAEDYRRAWDVEFPGNPIED